MITNFKIFEKKLWNDIEGEYVILKYTRTYNKKRYSQFFETNIGKVKKAYYPGSWFDVEYEDIPKVIEKYLENKGQFNTADILFRSKNREDCKAYLEAKKYNL